uniref:Uncharacterized protein n=1 Tax=Candidatus Nitrotoga fabula TaxID=2182327 RepID=A0A2X0RCL8_9PROT|nr:protein of unknown function [Candidatus Nitrotoga fabula]
MQGIVTTAIRYWFPGKFQCDGHIHEEGLLLNLQNAYLQKQEIFAKEVPWKISRTQITNIFQN